MYVSGEPKSAVDPLTPPGGTSYWTSGSRSRLAGCVGGTLFSLEGPHTAVEVLLITRNAVMGAAACGCVIGMAVSTRILGRRTAPSPRFLIPYRVPRGLPQDPSTDPNCALLGRAPSRAWRRARCESSWTAARPLPLVSVGTLFYGEKGYY